MGLKDLLLNKGWAGTTMSRRETVERLNPILHKSYPLLYTYESVVRRTPDRAVAEQIDAFLKILRTDIGKLAESVLSCGGVPYNGIDLDPQAYASEDDAERVLRGLRDLEDDFAGQLATELKENHQIRTRAVLSVVQTNSQSRLNYLRDATRSAK